MDQLACTPALHMPVRDLTRLLHAYGVFVVVDGAHAIGNVPCDFKGELADVDAWCASPHYLRQHPLRLHLIITTIIFTTTHTTTPAHPTHAGLATRISGSWRPSKETARTPSNLSALTPTAPVNLCRQVRGRPLRAC